jgi:hypothetical protein
VSAGLSSEGDVAPPGGKAVGLVVSVDGARAARLRCGLAPAAAASARWVFGSRLPASEPAGLLLVARDVEPALLARVIARAFGLAAGSAFAARPRGGRAGEAASCLLLVLPGPAVIFEALPARPAAAGFAPLSAAPALLAFALAAPVAGVARALRVFGAVVGRVARLAEDPVAGLFAPLLPIVAVVAPALRPFAEAADRVFR